MPTGKGHCCRRLEREPLFYFVYFINPYNDDLLVRKDGSDLEIPEFDTTEDPSAGKDMSQCNSRILERLTGIAYDMIFLYSNVNARNLRFRIVEKRVAVYECLGPVDSNTGTLIQPISEKFSWMNKYEVQRLTNERPGGVEYGFWTLFRDEEPFSEMGLRPWELPGWFIETTQEASSTLANLGYTLKGQFEQYRITQVGAVLRVETNKGRVYLKASTKREGSTVQCLSRFAPYLVPKPLHVNVEKEWFLMEDYGSEIERLGQEDCTNISILYGKLQLASMEHISELLEAGIRREGAEELFSRTKKMLEDNEIRKIFGGIEGFAPTDDGGRADLTKYLEGVLGFLKNLYEERGLPLTVVHGDMYSGNMMKMDKGVEHKYVLNDWGSAIIDLPFADVFGFQTHVVNGFKENAALDPYLELWAEYGTVTQLKEVPELLVSIIELKHALKTYELAKYKGIGPYLEDWDVQFLNEFLPETLRSSKKADESQ